MNYAKISEGLDVSQILEEIKENPHLWDIHQDRTWFEGSPHEQARDIWVRHNDPDDIADTDRFDPFRSVWYEAAEDLPSTVGFALKLMGAIEGEHLGGVLITTVPPGGKILPHVDTGWHVDFYDKFYLHLESNDDVEFCWKDGTKIQPKVGDLYWLDNSKEHWVNNNGDTPRTTLIVCAKPFIRMRDRVGGS